MSNVATLPARAMTLTFMVKRKPSTAVKVLASSVSEAEAKLRSYKAMHFNTRARYVVITWSGLKFAGFDNWLINCDNAL